LTDRKSNSTTGELDDRRRDYGERRIVTRGSVAGQVVYTWRSTEDEPVRWIISRRKAKLDYQPTQSQQG
jgi:uncharacterized DUF497 family protein